MKRYLILLLVFSSMPIHADIPPADVAVRVEVVDENGKPVPNASCKIGFDAPPKPPQTEGILGITGETDANGVLEVNAQTRLTISLGVEKPGYYKSIQQNRFDSDRFYEAFASGTPLAKWDELVTFKVVLKRIVNPVALFAKEVQTKIPKDGEVIGFDLEAGDWVAPYGQGSRKDLLFEATRNIVSPNDYSATLTLTFPNDGDGLLLVEEEPRFGSELRLSHEAPEGGYQPTKTWTYGRKPGEMHDGSTVWNEKHNYFLRVRTELNPDGSVKTAHYAKVHSDIRMYVGTKAPQAGLHFTCYFNPTANDQNLEFDTSNNLFEGERIKSP